MRPFIELNSNGKFNIKRVAIVKSVSQCWVVVLVEIDAHTMAVAAGPAVQNRSLVRDVRAGRFFFGLRTRIDNFDRIRRWRAGANFFESVQIDLVAVFLSHSRAGKHPLAALFIMTFTCNRARELPVNHGAISAR